ncbi:unnamed protein product [Rotaria sordida]|uniref:Uncharacterized protein n=1 Tax=Rotaria sordida TaxID=392033 RepID=A0A819Y3I1_9BILA|nr:unnamed protein product [Rotaria sordida]CAF4150205.1 unnamed protein product [Rotaria sordida]
MNMTFRLMFKDLKCYKHGYCLTKCSELSKSIIQCTKEESRCWKMISPLGNYQCELQVNVGVINTANVCCSGNLCNSSIKIKLITISIAFSNLIAFIYPWCFE